MGGSGSFTPPQNKLVGISDLRILGSSSTQCSHGGDGGRRGEGSSPCP